MKFIPTIISMTVAVALTTPVLAKGDQDKATKATKMSAPVMAASAQPTTDNTSLKLERETVNFTQILQPDEKLVFGESNQKTSSKSYYKRVSGAQLSKGVELWADGSEAIVRVTPVASSDGVQKSQQMAPALEPSDFDVISKVGAVNAKSATMSLKADSQQMNDAYPELFKNTAAFKLSADMGRGAFSLKTHQKVADNAQYMVHVFDKNSQVTLNAEVSRSHFKQGESINLNALLSKTSEISDYAVELRAPDGRRWDVPAKMQQQKLTTQWPINVNVQSAPGELWTLAVTMKAANGLERVAEVAIDLNEQTAKLDGIQAMNGKANAQLSIAKSGRYEVRAWVYGRDSSGKMVPAVLAHSASWFEPGQVSLPIVIDKQRLARTGLLPPYQIRQVKLMDQTRLAALQTEVNDWTLMGKKRKEISRSK
ncbi:DUF4785 domain-containing protein [Pleionea sp. CnH1-48]|uniref:DUF4785 domain-containing protein n=1 Tax=Pleionea sp. CnH1-48 TaxID=2954494 RepID=UPI002097CF8C|nr:DUF4785 domain-containing protein [Pleionea sp. CnH1-48]MCO7225137.1 DUF4785 family protein [Pleionea sp. CnH1-48]